MEKLGVKNFFDLKFISNLNIANGKIFFELYRPNEKDNEYESSIYELRGKRIERYSRGQKDKDMLLSPNCKMMIYTSKENKKSFLILKDIERGNERIIYKTDDAIKSYKWSKDSNSIFLITERKSKEEDYREINNYPVYFNGEGYIHNSEFKLSRISLTGKEEELFKGENQLIEVEPSYDKGKIVVIIREKGWDVYDSKLALYDSNKKSFEFITDEKAGFSNINFLADGRLVFLMNRHQRSIFESPKFYVYSENKIYPISEGHDISISNSVNSDSRMGKNTLIKVKDETIYFISTVKGRAGLYSLNLKGDMSEIIVGDFSIDCFDIYGNEIYYIAQSSNEPQEIYNFKNNKIAKKTNINKKILSYNLSKPENFNVRASDGKDIECWFMKGNGRGTILEIHGGPRTSYGEGFIFEFHLLNQAGFNILYSNPRGSDSYGNDFALEIKEKYGERDFYDINEILDYTISKYKIDPNKLGVNGGSYGGFMVNWIIGHTDRFKAAITDRSISDQVSFYFTSDIGPRFNGDQIGGNPLDNLEHYIDKSPIKYYRKVKTPLLIIHSDEDFRCPLSQALEFYTALKLNGNNVRLIIFKGENHELSRSGKPKNRVKRLSEILEWFENNI